MPEGCEEDDAAVCQKILNIPHSHAAPERLPDGTFVRIAGAVIARQRPGTASDFIFISGEDETGISNAIIHPKVYEQYRMAVTRGRLLLL